jgi:hypothetical protein
MVAKKVITRKELITFLQGEIKAIDSRKGDKYWEGYQKALSDILGKL